jgi:hypothetical protein
VAPKLHVVVYFAHGGVDVAGMVDFLIIFKVMSAYVRVRGPATARMQKTLETCREVGRAEPVPANSLLRAQTLAMRFWANAGVLVLLPIFVVGGLLALIRPGHAGDVVGAAFVGVFGAVSVAALGQVPVQTYRSHCTMRAVRRMGGRATLRPLPAASRGLPRKHDFWMAAMIPITAGAIYLILRVRYPNGP